MRFLAVDDEPIVLGVLRNAILEAEPTGEVLDFKDGEEALQAVEDGFSPDVAFLDMEMFGMTGTELARQLRDLSPATEVIFVTGHPQYALEAYAVHARGYLLKPVTAQRVREELDCLRPAAWVPRSARLRVQCFGSFEVFLDDAPLRFARSRTKELLAYLVDRRGAAATTGELCSVLWEDRGNELSQRNQLRVLLSDLTRTLTAAGLGEALVKRRNSFAVAPDRISCDLYEHLEGIPLARRAFRGEYMTQYSWAEVTLSALEREK